MAFLMFFVNVGARHQPVYSGEPLVSQPHKSELSTVPEESSKSSVGDRIMFPYSLYRYVS